MKEIDVRKLCGKRGMDYYDLVAHAANLENRIIEAMLIIDAFMRKENPEHTVERGLTFLAKFELNDTTNSLSQVAEDADNRQG